MKFSVLMSIYSKGDAGHFDAAVQSIVQQTLPPDEVVVVEDGPLTHELDGVIKKYQKQYSIFKVVKLAENSGLGAALNHGIKHCTHELVARMDADDISTPDRFKKQITYFKEFPESVIVGANIIEYDENMKNKLYTRVVPESAEAIARYAKMRNPFNHVTVMFRKSIINQVGGYQDCPYFEDYYLWLRVLDRSSSVRNMQESLVYVRGGSSMIARRGGAEYAKHCYNFLLKAHMLGNTNKLVFIKNICIRIPIAVAPARVREIIYDRSLRVKSDAK